MGVVVMELQPTITHSQGRNREGWAARMKRRTVCCREGTEGGRDSVGVIHFDPVT